MLYQKTNIVKIFKELISQKIAIQALEVTNKKMFFLEHLNKTMFEIQKCTIVFNIE